MSSDHREAVPQAVQAVPAIGAILTYLGNVPLEKWAAVAGLLFLAMQAGYLVWKWRRDIRRDRLGMEAFFAAQARSFADTAPE